MAARSYVLALDLGTTGNRAIVFDERQRIVSSAYREFTQYFPKPGWVEHDADEIRVSTLAVARRALSGVPASRLAAVGVTNQRETIVVWDRRTGRPLHRALVWQDRRTSQRCAQLKASGLGERLHRTTGLFADPYFSATKLEWLLRHVPGLRAKARRGEALAGTVDSWILWHLTGGAAHVTDTSNASRTLLFDLRRLRWEPWLLDLFGVPERMLPRVVPSSAVSARTVRSAIGVEVPIAGIAGDQQAASFAQGCAEPGVVKNTYGTGLFAVECTGRTPRFSRDLLTTVAWSLGDLRRTDYAVEGSVFIGGAAVQWLRDGLGLIRRSADVERLAASVEDAGGAVFVPALAGLGAPYWDPDARGLLIGLTRGTTRAHIARATLEAICYQTRDILTIMRRDTRHGFDRLRVDGGATADDLLMQLQADALGIPVERPRVLETTALGAAGLAGLAVGVWGSAEAFLRARRVERVFRPRRSTRGAMERGYGRWAEAVRRCRGWASAAQGRA
ncbi:MAG: Glycerol kinase [Candidatus Omnitrophica bacterium]|nr:Glycerol kinase [Candidatus Omnitrophota bacterium]